MTMVSNLRSKEHEQDVSLIQSMLGKAIRHSLQAVAQESLPDGMALLLLQLALAESLNLRIDERRSGHVPALMHDPQTELDKAVRHIAEAKRIVARQWERIGQLQAGNYPTEDALSVLYTFIETLAAMERHQRLLHEEAKGTDGDVVKKTAMSASAES